MHLFIFGLGYTALHLVKELGTSSCTITATKRSKVDIGGVEVIEYAKLKEIPSSVTHILVSVPPKEGRDIVFKEFGLQIAQLPNLKWLGYLSATSVYGDHGGAWVVEGSKLYGKSKRAIARLTAESQWLSLYENYNTPLHIFRLAGIYGQGRNPLERIKRGDKVIPIIKPGNYFSRIHVEDIVSALLKSILSPQENNIFNLCDDTPSRYNEVVEYAYELLGLTPPPSVEYEKANISPPFAEFFQDNRKVSNQKIKETLNWKPKYGSYKEGLYSIASKLLGQ